MAHKLPVSINTPPCGIVKEKHNMKKILALTSACLLIVNAALAGQSSEADQKWLQVVEKKVSAGQTQISTPAQERVALLKQWAASNGYSAQVTQTATSYRVELSKSLAQK